MATAYITENGAFLTKEGDKLLIKKGDKIIQTILSHHLERLIICGNVTLTTQTVAFLLDKGIDTVFMSVYGKYRGRLMSRWGKNIELRKQQFDKFSNLEYTLPLAKEFVRGKLENCNKLLRRRLVRRKNLTLQKCVMRIRGIQEQLQRAKTLDELRGYEGKAAVWYFQGLAQMIMRPEFAFTERNRRPPRDKTNALLSLCYTFLHNTVQSYVDASSLDPFYGVFHQMEYGRPSLGLDLMEEFRPVIVDTLVLNLINRSIILVDDFIIQPEAELPVRLSTFGMKKVIIHFEKRLRQKIYFPEYNQSLSYEQLIENQLFSLQRFLLEGKPYKAFTILK